MLVFVGRGLPFLFSIERALGDAWYMETFCAQPFSVVHFCLLLFGKGKGLTLDAFILIILYGALRKGA